MYINNQPNAEPTVVYNWCKGLFDSTTERTESVDPTQGGTDGKGASVGSKSGRGGEGRATDG
jgi:hypothetical protein